ncbi:lytic murein transglycosylase [Alcanivorax sp. 1008]|uniref:lytic murein transglycosylase n=1 Tax=Alcanivorax sp. 1008 TaxID=2816853 RepID=UPI001D2B821C|nr:lytic murein transglycosylase [Alcanivorax sp. 1008]MCC1497826.1 lytic murein transglycosylase [Alcanivorax sp. 1008]
MLSRKLLLSTLIYPSLIAVFPATAQAENPAEFATCVEQLKSTALQQGISNTVVERDLAAVNYVERVIELDRRQPEFSESFATYFERRVTEDRIVRGRELLAEHRSLLNRVSKEFGVPPQYLVAFWGLETNFGGFFGKMPVLDSLATLACDQRRSEYFTGELINALKIIDEGSITASRMQGSWAGAMGHTQFMPSVFLRYAIDYDGDDKRDLWGSLPDALASAANFLRGIGWRKEERWGREVKLPNGFAFENAGLGQTLSLSQWSKLGVRQANGSALPRVDMKASLLVPSGHQGPAFLVYENFHVIMRWNRAEAYALAVGHLADRINGAGKLSREPVQSPRLNRDQVMQLQQALNEQGFAAGNADGVLGPGTRAAISRYQKSNGQIADGFPGKELLEQFGVVTE